MTMWEAFRELLASPLIVIMLLILVGSVVLVSILDRRARREQQDWFERNIPETEEYWDNGVRFTRLKRKEKDR